MPSNTAEGGHAVLSTRPDGPAMQPSAIVHAPDDGNQDNVRCVSGSGPLAAPASRVLSRSAHNIL